MKAYGYIIEYDGYTGVIKGNDGYNYLLLDRELESSNLSVGDFVSFDAEIYKDLEFTKYIARFVKKVEKR